MIEENLDVFVDDFGRPVVLHLPGGDRSITGIFDNAFFDSSVGEVVLDTTQPRFTCKESAITGLKREMEVTVADRRWSVIQIQPDGTGMSTVMLSHEINPPEEISDGEDEDSSDD